MTKNRPLILGTTLRLKKQLETDPEIRALVKSGRLMIVGTHPWAGLFGLVHQARRALSTGNRLGLSEKPVFHFMIQEDVDLPLNFFDLTAAQRRLVDHEVIVYFFSHQAAFHITRDLLPRWDEIRNRLVQA